MKKPTTFDIIRKITAEVEQPLFRPSMENMLREIQMMKFKVRQIDGDISTMLPINDGIIESVWKIGKINDIINQSLHLLSEDDQIEMMDYLDNMELMAQKQVDDILTTEGKPTGKKKMIRLEIFRDEELDYQEN